MLLRRQYQALVLSIGLALCLAFPAYSWAEGKTYAVVVGIGNYQDSNLQSRPGLDRDAQSLYNLLTSPTNRPLYSPENVKLLLSKVPADNKAGAVLATRENLMNAIKWAVGTAKEEDTLVIYWAGSGAPFEKTTVYFATDSTLADRGKNAVSASELELELEKLKTGKVAVFLDVNFRGYVPNPKVVGSEDGLDNRFQEFTGRKKKTNPLDEEDDEAEAAFKGRMLLTSSRGFHPAPEVDGKNVFSTLLHEALTGKADKEGDDADGQVTIDEVVKFVSEEYFKRANIDMQLGLLPFVAGKSLHFTVSLNAPALEKAIAASKQFAVKAADDKLGAEVVKEGTEFILHMPREESERKLRKKFLEYNEGKLAATELTKAHEEMVAGLKITRPDAEKFAEKVYRVMRFVRDLYVKPIKLDEMAVNAVKGLYRVADEKMPADLKERIEKFRSTDEDEIKSLLADARQALGNKDAVKDEKGLDRALKLMLYALDRHTSWFNQEEFATLERDVGKEFIGVGIQIRKDFKRDVVKVATPILDGPSYRKGIKAGDLIVRIVNEVDKDGNPLPKPEVTETKGLTTTDVVKKILGPRNTKVTLVIEREEKEGPKEYTFELTRSKIEAETVFGVRRLEDDTWDYYLDADRKIVYVRLNQFALNTGKQLREVLRTYKKKGMNGLILDLRFNGGGYLPVAQDICSMFVEDGVVVAVKPRDKRQSIEYRVEKRREQFLDVPVVVLINGGSASASEIVSACIQDHERGIVMGERSFGKGSVQQIRPMDLGTGTGAVKVTVASFYGPSGRNLNKFPNSKDEDEWGVKPPPQHTIKLSPTERDELEEHLQRHEVIARKDPPRMEEKKTFIDRQLDAALDVLRKQTTANTGQNK
jgi:C-terminal peptidase prc